MSLTVFLAFCVLGVDFMIYFFFKMVYGEKRRIRPRRLPPEYYSRKGQTSPLYLVPPREKTAAQRQGVSSPCAGSLPSENCRIKPPAAVPLSNSPIASSLAQTKLRRVAGP